MKIGFTTHYFIDSFIVRTAIKRVILAFFFLLLLANISFGSIVQVVTIPSKAMNKKFKATIIIPDSYTNAKKRFCVIYFLHGYSGNHATWVRNVPLLKEYSDTYQLIFVCPDGAYNSWYLDSPVKPDSKFETYIVFEVTAWVDSTYKTVGSYNGRALIGSSMGGHGALTLLLKHPGRYAGASSISGIMDISMYPGEWDIATVLGDFRDNKTLWQNNTVFYLIDRIPNHKKAILLDCGIDDFALDGNRRTHKKLTALEIPHDYREQPGGHTPSYVRKSVEYHIIFFAKAFRQ